MDIYAAIMYAGILSQLSSGVNGVRCYRYCDGGSYVERVDPEIAMLTRWSGRNFAPPRPPPPPSPSWPEVTKLPLFPPSPSGHYPPASGRPGK